MSDKYVDFKKDERKVLMMIKKRIFKVDNSRQNYLG